MSDETRLNELLLRWEELREQGQAAPSAEQLCADCPELAEELCRRIRDLERVDAWLGAPAERTADGETPLPPASGRYRAVRFHARGGLGEVFVADDEELQRQVALKRMQPARHLDAECRQRFLREAEITARLEHPGIVPVHGLVRDSEGQPCYAMRLIQERPCTRRSSASTSRPRPAWGCGSC